MKLKKLLCCLTAFAMLLTATTAYAGTNWDSGDADELAEALDGENIWRIYDSSGTMIDCAEGLRVTVYDADNETKVYNTIDISGNPLVAGVQDIRFFADNNGGGAELIPKTTWLEAGYVGTTYNDATSSSKQKFHNKVASKVKINGYRSEYVPALASLTIISEDNTANLEAIRSLIGDENFLKNLCDLISGLEYDDFADGKYKIAFEPIAYMTIAGSAWVLTATECGILDKYMLDILNSSTGALLSKMGPLTHSQLPLSAFLSYKELGIQKFAASDNDITYSNSGAVRYRNHCIIRSMGIGIVAGSEKEEDTPVDIDTETQYHTDTDVYTSFTFVNTGDDNLIAGSSFSIYNSEGETPKTTEEPCGDKYVVSVSVSYQYDDNGNIIGGSPSFTYGYNSMDTAPTFLSSTAKVKVYAPNPKFDEQPYGVAPYKQVGTFKDGEMISSSGGASIAYTITNKSGKTIKSGTASFSCPAGEEAMGWFKWHTPSKEQDITITLKPTNDDVKILDEDGNRYDSVSIDASIVKVEEITPPDPKVSDKRPEWQKVYNRDSIAEHISDYAPKDNVTELTWYVWAYDWYQHDLGSKMRYFNYITEGPDYSKPAHDMYMGCDYESVSYFATSWGVDNTYWASETAKKVSGKKITGAVILTGEAYKIEYKVSLTADMEITPSQRCQTATYSSTTDTYTMKSGYGYEIAVNAHLDGDTQYCTGSQTANVLFPEFNFNRMESKANYNRLLEQVGGVWVFKKNEYSTYKDRVHFTPIWYPDNKYYTVYAEVFDVWCPAGQLSVRLTDSMRIKGNVYDDWHISPT